MSEDLERTLCQIPHVFVFKIPPRKTAEGHRAADWPKEPSWTGKVKIVARGSTAAIILQDDQNQVFAVCQVSDDTAVEKTLDSGRYFVLRISNQQGRHAYIGIAFNERTHAFDFNVALNEFKHEIERENAATVLAASVPAQDYSLKSGEKIKIKITPKKVHEDDAFATQHHDNNSHNTTTSKSSDPWGSDPWGNDPWASDPFATAPSHTTDPWANSAQPTNTKKPTPSTNVNLLDL